MEMDITTLSRAIVYGEKYILAPKPQSRRGTKLEP